MDEALYFQERQHAIQRPSRLSGSRQPQGCVDERNASELWAYGQSIGRSICSWTRETTDLKSACQPGTYISACSAVDRLFTIDYENYQAALAAWEQNRRHGEAPRKPVEPQGPRADIQEVLTPVFIRRRRRDIHEIYRDSAEINGRPVQFPQPVLGNVEYRLDKVYEKAGSLDEIEALLRKHKAYRYRQQYIKGRCEIVQNTATCSVRKTGLLDSCSPLLQRWNRASGFRSTLTR